MFQQQEWLDNICALECLCCKMEIEFSKEVSLKTGRGRLGSCHGTLSNKWWWNEGHTSGGRVRQQTEYLQGRLQRIIWWPGDVWRCDEGAKELKDDTKKKMSNSSILWMKEKRKEEHEVWALLILLTQTLNCRQCWEALLGGCRQHPSLAEDNSILSCHVLDVVSKMSQNSVKRKRRIKFWKFN